MRTSTLAMLLSSTLALGCGHSEDEWRAQLAKYDTAVHGQEATRAQLEEAQRRIDELTKQLEGQGVEVGKLSKNLEKTNASLEEREKALAEYEARAKQLEAIKKRFELLRSKLEELTKLGLAVNIRKNRMVISLPGDVLFDSGKDTLRKDGEDILRKIAAVLRADPTLVERQYQVAGHTDSQPLKKGQFEDNWDLSLQRARAVLLYLHKNGIRRDRWSAAGFADTDPVATNDTPDGKQKNRRCELIVMPDVDEMLDLKSLTKE
jgi:chemotaxis protein MotB